MADDRDRNQGMKQGTGEGDGQHAPGRNPQDDRSAGGQQGGFSVSQRALLRSIPRDWCLSRFQIES